MASNYVQDVEKNECASEGEITGTVSVNDILSKLDTVKVRQYFVQFLTSTSCLISDFTYYQHTLTDRHIICSLRSIASFPSSCVCVCVGLGMCVGVHACMCVCACVHACVRACACVY